MNELYYKNIIGPAVYLNVHLTSNVIIFQITMIEKDKKDKLTF